MKIIHLTPLIFFTCAAAAPTNTAQDQSPDILHLRHDASLQSRDLAKRQLETLRHRSPLSNDISDTTASLEARDAISQEVLDLLESTKDIVTSFEEQLDEMIGKLRGGR